MSGQATTQGGGRGPTEFEARRAELVMQIGDVSAITLEIYTGLWFAAWLSECHHGRRHSSRNMG